MALCKAAELELTLSDFPILKDFFVIADDEDTGDWLGPDVAPSDEDKTAMLRRPDLKLQYQKQQGHQLLAAPCTSHQC